MQGDMPLFWIASALRLSQSILAVDDCISYL